MKKNELVNIVKRKIEHKTLNDLLKRKEAHEKVQNLKHPSLRMQEYLKASNKQMKIEDCQNIFKMRCRVTKTKLNMKKLYNAYECRACKVESESDAHIIECNVLLNMNKEVKSMKIPEYKKLYDGKPNEQLEITKMFNSNMKILENIKEENVSTLLGPGDQIIFSESAVCTDTMYKLIGNKLID